MFDNPTVLTVLQILLCVAFPGLALGLASRYRLFKVVGPVLLCYFAGMLIGNIPNVPLLPKVSESITEATIPLAIPLLLFSAHFKAWFKHSRSAVLSFALAVVAVFIASMGTALLLGDTLDNGTHVAAMLAGTYTGGTPNMLSVGAALQADKNTIVVLNIADTIVSGSYLLLLMALAKPLLKRFYPAYKPVELTALDDSTISSDEATNQNIKATQAPTRKAQLKGMGIALGLSLLVVGLSVGLTIVIFGKMEVAPIIFGITTGGILGSFAPKIRTLPGSYGLGNYLILIFCVAIGTLTQFSKLVGASSSIIIFCCVLMTSAVLLHYIFAAIARIDIDTLIITSTAAVMGPAFIGLVTESIGNRQVLLSGLTTGLVGYAVGNYLGLFVATLLQTF